MDDVAVQQRQNFVNLSVSSINDEQPQVSINDVLEEIRAEADDYIEHENDANLNRVIQGSVKDIINDVELHDIGTTYLLHSDVYEMTMVSVSSNLGCSLKCWEFDTPSQCFLLKPMYEKPVVYKDMLNFSKKVVDYVCLDYSEMSQWEMMIEYDSVHQVRMENMLTMYPETQIDTLIIESWCIFLNDLYAQDRKKFFMGIHYADSLHKWMTCGRKEKAKFLKEIYGAFDEFLKINEGRPEDMEFKFRVG